MITVIKLDKQNIRALYHYCSGPSVRHSEDPTHHMLFIDSNLVDDLYYDDDKVTVITNSDQEYNYKYGTEIAVVVIKYTFQPFSVDFK